MTVSVERMWRRNASEPLAAPLDDRGRSRRSELGKTRSRVSRLGALRPTGPTALRCLGAQAPAGLWLAVAEAARLWRQRNGWSGNRRLAAYVEPRFGAALRAGIGRSKVCPRVVSSSRSREASFGTRQARSALKSGARRRGLARGEKSPWAKGRRDPGRGGKVVASAKAPRKGPLRWKASRAARPHRVHAQCGTSGLGRRGPAGPRESAPDRNQRRRQGRQRSGAVADRGEDNAPRRLDRARRSGLGAVKAPDPPVSAGLTPRDQSGANEARVPVVDLWMAEVGRTHL